MVAVFAAGACSPKPARVSVSRIVINAPPKYDDAKGERDAVRKRVFALFAEDSSVDVPKASGRATHRLEIRIHPVINKDGTLVRPIHVTLAGESDLFETVGRGPPEGHLVDSVVVGFEDAWSVMLRMRTLVLQKDEALLEALSDPDLRIRDFAIRQVGSRRVKEAVQPLIAMLGSEQDDTLVFAAIGSLVAIGDEAAVKPLIDLTERKDAQSIVQVVFAVAALGGRMAEGFLVTLASGHPSEIVQQGAKDALQEMKLSQRSKEPAQVPKSRSQ